MSAGHDLTLVCGGGGVWGVAWMTGLVTGLADAGLDVRQATAFVGTSAGAVVSSHLSSSLSTEALFRRQADRAEQTPERAPPPGAADAMVGLMQRSWSDPREKVRALCELALKAETISSAERRADIVARLALPDEAWPTKPLSITAVDADSQELCVFTATSGIPLADVIAASCAVPGVWPVMPIGGRRYIDGGVWRTAENAHLAAGSKAVLILSPMGRLTSAALAPDIARLEVQGAEVVVISADEASLRTMAPGALDPATRKPAAEAGRLQGAREVARARTLFGLR
ncbi:MAG: patatin [Caulobacter sp.]|nr:patatin [Caulobacter sp.]